MNKLGKGARFPTPIVALVGLSMLFLVPVLDGCEKEAEKPAPIATEETVAGFVNVRCPMMGTAITAAEITSDLIRQHKGKKVAFCCAGCLAGWDKLTDAEKDERLSKAVP